MRDQWNTSWMHGRSRMKLSEAISQFPNSVGGIYVLTCVNRKVYIGQATNFRRRATTHYSALRKGRCRNPPLQAAWNKYGDNGFTIQILETQIPTMRATLCDSENRWMNTYRALSIPLFNICPAAESQLGAKRSLEVRQRMSASRTGRQLSKETRRKMGEAHRGNTVMLGRKLSVEWRRNIGRASTGRKIPAESLRKRGMKRRERYGFISPDGRVMVIKGLNDWCKDHGLHLGAMCFVHSGKIEHHKGWRKAA